MRTLSKHKLEDFKLNELIRLKCDCIMVCGELVEVAHLNKGSVVKVIGRNEVSFAPDMKSLIIAHDEYSQIISPAWVEKL